MEKQYKFRIYPTKEQKVQIQKNFGCVRFVYNYYLEKCNKAYQDEKRIMNLNECCRDMTVLKKQPGYEWLAEADDNSLRYALRDLDFAYKSFFRAIKQKGSFTGFPKFKNKRETRQSYRSKNNIVRHSVDVFDKGVKLPKLGYVACKVSRQIEGRILFATILQVPSGKYFVSICCTEVEPATQAKTGTATGIHMGIRNLATLSDGQRFENIRAFEKSRSKIARLQRQLSRKPKGSKNHEKARLRLARAYEKATNRKHDFLHKLTTQLVRDYDLLCVRDAPFAERSKQPWYSKYAFDAGWNMFIRQLEYKCNWYGKELIKVSSKHPSVQLCSACGYKNTETKVKQTSQSWTCPKCDIKHNRAINAAINILNEGIDPKYVRRGAPEVKPDDSA